ncbi:MAG: nitroreductase family protein [Flammeovirgaceae bacterium]|nr:nitroreductase family protein [Flammeovirgaceae bacterium]
MESKEINGHTHIKYDALSFDSDEILNRSKVYYELMDQRRSVRDISDQPVEQAVIENIIQTASTAPSGAHKQPWTFCAVSNPEVKKQIRAAAEKEEYESYHGRMSERWLKDLEPIGTDWHKPFLEKAPWLIIVFKKVYELSEGSKANNYYVNESVGIACGMLISAIHNAGLVTLTHTPSPMNFLSEVLERPSNERPFLLLHVGHPEEEVFVPDLHRKPLNEVSTFYK